MVLKELFPDQSISISWELSRDANSKASAQTYLIRNSGCETPCIFTNQAGDSRPGRVCEALNCKIDCGLIGKS